MGDFRLAGEINSSSDLLFNVCGLKNESIYKFFFSDKWGSLTLFFANVTFETTVSFGSVSLNA